jgi:hypothetical protein
MSLESLMGMKVQSSPYATQTRYKVGKWAIKKRRRGWRVVKVEEPCAYIIGNHTAILHPSLIERLKNVSG